VIGMTVCSGIGAPELSAPWIDWRYQSEIEPFPCAVLRERFPDAVNLGDMTRFQEWPDADVDVLAGGTPCQSFSVAGLRKGLADPRGNLTLTFLKIARRYKPQYIVWENVPGVVSDKDDALGQFMEGLNSLGYAIDCDILDAQHFGLAQRRRRVFLVCHNIDIGRQKRTPLFANATGQFLSEMLLSVLAEASDPSRLGASVSEWPARITRAGLMPKMRCFGAASETLPTPTGLTAFLTKLHDDWVEALTKCGSALNTLGSSCETACDQVAGDTVDGASLASMVEPQSLSTVPSWSSISAVVCDLMNTSTTSTATRTITPSTIYICAQASLSIVQSIIRSTTSPASYFDGDGSGLTALKAFTGYARQAASDLFGNLDGLCDWHGFVSEAEGAIRELERGLGDRAHTGTLFSDPEGLQGHPAPRREAQQSLAARTTRGAAVGCAVVGCGRVAAKRGWCETHYQRWRTTGEVGGAEIASPGKALTARFWEKVDKSGECWNWTAAKNEKGYGIFWTGKGGRNVRAHRFAYEAAHGEIANGLQIDHLCRNPACCNPSHLEAVTPQENTRRGDAGKHWAIKRGDKVDLARPLVPVAFGAQNSAAQGDDVCDNHSPPLSCTRTPAVLTSWAVRRLTPRECERLQGFPDGWTRIPYRNKPADACPDGPRYKALGNSWAINCGQFVFDRIKAVEEIMQEAAECSA